MVGTGGWRRRKARQAAPQTDVLFSSHTQGLLSPYHNSVVDFSAFAVLVESCPCVVSHCPCHNVYITISEVTLHRPSAGLE